jgi:hypothetical protein
VIVVEHQDNGPLQQRTVVEKERQRDVSQRGGAGLERRACWGADIGLDRLQRVDGAGPEADRIVVGRSSDTQAKGRSSDADAHHSASSVVFPKPTGAPSRVSFRGRPRTSNSTKPSRGTMPARTLGICSLVAGMTLGPAVTLSQPI